MGKTKLRTKFLLSLLVVITGLTSATLFVVRYSVQRKIRASLLNDLNNSVKTYQTFERQRQVTMTQAARLIANLPNVRALMTTQDLATIQDESASIWHLSGSDMLMLADRSGQVVGVQSKCNFTRRNAQEFFDGTSQSEGKREWWVSAGGHLFEVWLQPVYFGTSSDPIPIGTVALGHEINDDSARDFSEIASSEVLFRSGQIPIAGTLPIGYEEEFSKNFHMGAAGTTGEIQLGNARYLVSTVALSHEKSAITMSVLKSLDQTTSFLNNLNRILLSFGFVSVLAGSCLVFLVSHTFTRPLNNLVSGVRALEEGDFTYPVANEAGDEVAEVSAAFARMRVSLLSTQKEQKQLEQQLRQAHKMEAVGRLAGGVAHDFNNLLTIIRGNSDLLADREGADNFQRRCVEQIQKAADRAVSMTRQLLAFSRMQILQPRVLDLNGIISEMGKMFPRLIGEHIEYRFNPGVQLEPVMADVGQMEQVVLNLVVNSRDAMPQGGKLTVATQNITMSAKETSVRAPMTPGKYVLLSVSDTGQGMDDETKAHIFEPFFTTKEAGKGTGLGLAMVYGIIKQSGGFVWVDSSPENGTRFDIYLPSTTQAIPSPDLTTTMAALPRGTETILVVEDEAGVRDLTCQFLDASGYRVLQAKDGIEALEIIAGHNGPIHLVLSDMIMPLMGGTELASHLELCCPNIRVMFMTGYFEYSSSEEKSFSTSDHSRILHKPFSKRTLLKKIGEVLVTSPGSKPTELEGSRVKQPAHESQFTRYPGQKTLD